MALKDTLARWMGIETRTTYPLPFNDWVEMFGLGGLSYPTIRQTLQGTVEEIGPDFEGLAQGAFKRNREIISATEIQKITGIFIFFRNRLYLFAVFQDPCNFFRDFIQFAEQIQVPFT